MKTMLLLAVLLAFANVCIAQSPKPPPPTLGIPMAKTPRVCIVSPPAKAVYLATYQGKKYGFCCQKCVRDFKSNPRHYANLAKQLPQPK